ncbi:MAG: hypothetical protein ABEI86_12280, partial [Halobacteriaceae archaeon]
EAIPLFNKGNSIYLSGFVLYEYCNRGSDDPGYVSDPSTLQLDPAAERGVFDDKVSELNDPLLDFEDAIERAALEDDLSFEWVVKTFFEHFDFREDDYQVVVDYFSHQLDTDRLSFRSVQQAARDLVDMVYDQAVENKEMILTKADVVPSKYDEMMGEKHKIEEHMYPHRLANADMAIVLDAVNYCKENEIGRFVTGDKGDILPVQEALAELYDLSVIFL